jgi:hypothetical protein
MTVLVLIGLSLPSVNYIYSISRHPLLIPSRKLLNIAGSLSICRLRAERSLVKLLVAEGPGVRLVNATE